MGKLRDRSCAGLWVWLAVFAAPGPALAVQRELIQDRKFERGFVLWKPEPGKLVRYGALNGLKADSDPVWSLYQWSSRFPFEDSLRAETSDGALIFKNAAKSVAIGGAAEREAMLSLAANTRVEYGAKARSAKDPWVHLLVQQDFDPPAALDQLSTLRLKLAARLVRSNNLHVGDYSPDIHAAQFQLFFTVQNRNPKSAGYGDYLWFGVPLYDNRSRFAKAFKEQDFGGTAKYIFTPAGSEYSQASTHDGDWVAIDKDLLPMVREALEAAWSRGFLKDSKDVADYYIAGMNMGWELPGTFDVEMVVKGLSLVAVDKK